MTKKIDLQKQLETFQKHLKLANKELKSMKSELKVMSKEQQIQSIEIKNTVTSMHADMTKGLADMAEGLAGLFEVHKIQSEIRQHVEKIAEVHRTIEEKRSFSMLYFSIFLSALVGVVGNFFVSLMFQESTGWTIIGWAMSGGILLGILHSLWREFLKQK